MSLYSKSYILNSSRKGFSLIEVLVAVTVITVALVAVLSSAARGVELSRRGLEETQAAFLLEEAAEALKFARDVSWDNLAALSNNADYYPAWGASGWSMAAGAETVGKFTRKTQFSPAYRDSSNDLAATGAADSAARKVIVSVVWNTGGSAVTKNLEFYVVNLFE